MLSLFVLIRVIHWFSFPSLQYSRRVWRELTSIWHSSHWMALGAMWGRGRTGQHCDPWGNHTDSYPQNCWLLSQHSVITFYNIILYTFYAGCTKEFTSSPGMQPAEIVRVHFNLTSRLTKCWCDSQKLWWSNGRLHKQQKNLEEKIVI